jgi:hypothetical protein
MTLGSARASRALFGASPNGVFRKTRRFSARTPKTAREARALPRIRVSPDPTYER